MRVAIELQPCCWARGGIGTYTWELARRLRDRDGLEFCGNLFNFCGRNDNSAALEGIDMPIRVDRMMPYGLYRRIWNWLPIPYQSLFPGKADLSVFFNFIVPPHVSGYVMTTIYDLTCFRCPETMESENLKHLRKGIAYSARRSDRILTISGFSKREIVEAFDVPEERVSIVPCAPSLPEEPADFQTCKEKFRIQRPYLSYVGTIEPRKNLERLLLAFELLKREHHVPHQLVLAGGKGWRDEGIYRTAAGLSCARDVVFTGYVTQAEKSALYRNADAFVFPSLYEGFGMPPLEAMAQGCPVVCSGAASLPEVVGDAAELVDPLEVEDIARGIWRVLSDSGHAAGLVERGHRQAKRFTWDASAEKLTQICKDVLCDTL